MDTIEKALVESVIREMFQPQQYQDTNGVWQTRETLAHTLVKQIVEKIPLKSMVDACVAKFEENKETVMDKCVETFIEKLGQTWTPDETTKMINECIAETAKKHLENSDLLKNLLNNYSKNKINISVSVTNKRE